MQESPESISGKANILVQSLTDKIRDNLCAAEAKKRRSAVHAILREIDPEKNPEDKNVLQSLPLALIQSQEYIGALYFLETCITNGTFFDPQIIDTVIQSTSRERTLCIRDGDIEASETINTILKKLYNLILAHPKYQKIPEIYLSIGNYQEGNKDTMSAIELYNEALGLGSIESYMYLGTAYESNSRYDMSTNIFTIAYQLSGEIRFLHRLVHALCKSGKREEAYQRYLELQENAKVPISPFLVYLDDIRHDNDLDAFSQLVVQYHLKGSFEPSTILTSLANKSSVYIANEIEKESRIIGDLNAIFLDVWTDEHDREYWRAISRRLYLMQTHIITLADSRYLKHYLDEMRRYTIDGNLRTQEMLRRFFTDSFSPYVLASYRQCAIAATLSTKQERELDREERDSYRRDIQALQDTIPMELYESMTIHLIQISAIFSQHSFYEITRDVIAPFIEACMRQDGEFDEGDDQSNQDTIQELKKELDEYDSYTPATKKFYEDYIEFFDKKYGMFYRRNLQLLVRDELSIPSSLRSEYDRVFIETGGNHSLTRDIVLSNMSVFLDYPDVALLFLIEKIIAGQDIIGEDETIDIVVEKYQLQTLIERDAILFTALLYERGDSHDDAMEYIVSIPDILDVPQVLSMLMEWLRYMDDAQRIDTLLGLDQVIQTEYDAKDFFEQVETIADDILNTDDATDSDNAYMLMAIAHMQIIQDKDYHQVKVGLSTAGELGLSLGYIASGDISQNVGDFDEAIRLFTLAHLVQPDIVSIRRLIGCLIQAARFDEAQTYIDIALREGYNISGFILAWHLYQGNVRQSIEQMVYIHQSDGHMDMTMPEGCMELLSDTIDQLLAGTTSTQDIYELKILASYINISMKIESDELDPANYIVHMDCIGSMMDSYRGDDLTIALYHIMGVLVSDIDLDDKKSTTDKLNALLQMHFSRIHASLMGIHIKNQTEKNVEATINSFNNINEFVGLAIAMLRRFPDTESYLKIWRKGLNVLPTQHHLDHTIHTMPETVQ